MAMVLKQPPAALRVVNAFRSEGKMPGITAPEVPRSKYLKDAYPNDTYLEIVLFLGIVFFQA